MLVFPQTIIEIGFSLDFVIRKKKLSDAKFFKELLDAVLLTSSLNIDGLRLKFVSTFISKQRQ